MTLSQSLNKDLLQPIALLVSIYFPPEPGGGSVTAWNRALILRKMGYAVFVLCGFPSYPTGKVSNPAYKGKLFHVEKTDGITLIRLRLLPIKSSGYLRRFILFINFIFLSLIYMPKIQAVTTKVTLVYSIAPILFSSIIGFIYSRLTKSFFIYEVSAIWPEELISTRTSIHFIVEFLGKILAKISYCLPDMIVVISEFAAKYIANHYKPNVKIYVLPIGVEPSRFPILSKGSARKKLIEEKIFPSFLENKFIILYAGIITKTTKVQNIINAAEILKDDESNIAFVIVGEGEEKIRLEKIKMAQRLDNVFFLPFQAGYLVPYIISSADVCVVPLSSEPIYEGVIPTKFFDYLACHKPQIGICGAELAKIINVNKIGITVNDGELHKLVDAILCLKSSPSLIQSMEENSKSLLQYYSLTSLSSEFKEALKKEISKKI